MSAFAVGEVAMFWDPGSRYHGTDVTIKAPLELHDLIGWPLPILAHEIRFPFATPPNTRLCAPLEHLRKKRPPQDWNTLCKLDSVPTTQEETA